LALAATGFSFNGAQEAFALKKLIKALDVDHYLPINSLNLGANILHV
jgi:hypothetical protein